MPWLVGRAVDNCAFPIPRTEMGAERRVSWGLVSYLSYRSWVMMGGMAWHVLWMVCIMIHHRGPLGVGLGTG